MNNPVNFIDPEGLYLWEIIVPTDMGSNSMVVIDKNGGKSVYDFDTGESKPYWENKKIYCETQQNPNINTTGPKLPAERKPQTKFQKLLVFLEIFAKILK